VGELESDEQPTLLVIDDDERIVELVQRYLGGRGFDVRIAPDFTVAREQIATGEVQLVLSDIRLEREDGVEELGKLEQEGILPPTVVVSGNVDPDSAERAQALGSVVAMMTKPFMLRDLEARLRTVLDGEHGA